MAMKASMPAMSGAQKKKLQQLQDTLATSGNEATLQQILVKCKWDVNTAVDYVFTNNVRLAASAGAAAMNSGNYRPNNTVALFDSMKSRNEDGETVMD